jgi:hypothetical protein
VPEQARAAAAARSEMAGARTADLPPYLDAAERAGAATLCELAAAVTARGIPTPAGRGARQPEQIRRVLAGRSPTLEDRQAFLDRASAKRIAVAEKIKVLGGHWAYPGAGYTERRGVTYRFIAA